MKPGAFVCGEGDSPVRGVAPAPTLAVVVESGPSGTRVVTPPFGGVVSPQAAANQATSSTPALAHRCARLIRPALLIGHDVFIAASIRSPAPRPQCRGHSHAWGS